MSNLKSHAELEFRAAGWLNEDGTFKDDMQEAICNHVLALLEVFDQEGHSGSSAPYAIRLFSKLASFEPVVPLTGEDWEWNSVGDRLDPVLQNRRCSHVFKSPDRFGGQAYDSEAVIFYEWYTDEVTGERYKSSYTCRDSAQPITFPYTPERRYVERGVDRGVE